eukprot:659593-Rhodomonas_salina.1
MHWHCFSRSLTCTDTAGWSELSTGPAPSRHWRAGRAGATAGPQVCEDLVRAGFRSRTAHGLEGALGTPGERIGVAPPPPPPQIDRQDGAWAGGAAPTHAPGRQREARDCCGRTGFSSPPTGCTLTTKGSRPNGTPFPWHGAATAGVP